MSQSVKIETIGCGGFFRGTPFIEGYDGYIRNRRNKLQSYGRDRSRDNTR